MKLCIVTHTVNKGDGQGRVNYEVTLEALRRGHHVTLIASSIAPDLMKHPQARWIPIWVKQYPSALLKEIIFSQRSARWINKHRSEFDLVKVNGAITSGSSDINAVHFVHSTWLKSNAHPFREHKSLYGVYHWFYSLLNTQWEKRAFHNCRVVIAVSEKIKQEIVQLGIPEASIHVIYNGVDLEEFCPSAGDRQTLGLPENVPLALFAGDIRTSRKNLDTVLKALVHVPNLHLAVVAATEDSPYLKLSTELSLESRIHFLGYRQDIATIMQAADFFVFPSRYEPFGMVVIEAMASGLPIITANTTGASVLVRPENGFVLPGTDDTQSLAIAMNTLANDLEQCHEMGKAGRQIAEQYSWKQQARCYTDLFESLVAS